MIGKNPKPETPPPVGRINHVEFVEPRDIPERVSDELERLHQIVSNVDGHWADSHVDWAVEKIDQIHKVFFCQSFTVGQEPC